MNNITLSSGLSARYQFGLMNNFLKYCLPLIIVIFLSGCGSPLLYVTPQPDVVTPSGKKGNSPIPIIPFGEKFDKSFQMTGHVYTEFSSGLADTLPLNYKAPIPNEAKDRLIDIANRVGADAIIDVVQAGYFGWSYAGQGVSGITVKYIAQPDHQVSLENKADFIACLMPITSDEKKRKVDQAVRIKGRHFLIAKGYYVLTPDISKYYGDLSSIGDLSDQELDDLCGHVTDVFVFFHKSKDDELLSLSVYSKKKHTYVIKDGRSTDGSGSNAAGGFVSGGLIGLLMGVFADSLADNIGAGEPEVKKMIDLMPNLPASCAGRQGLLPVFKCDSIDNI